MRATRLILNKNKPFAIDATLMWQKTTQKASDTVQAVANTATDTAIDQLFGVLRKAETRMLDEVERDEWGAKQTELTATANLGVVTLSVRKTYD